MSTSSGSSLLNAVFLIGLTTINGTLYGIAFTLFCLCALSLYLQLRDPEHRRQTIFTLVHMSFIMAIGLINLAVDARGMQESFINHADDPEGGGFMYHQDVSLHQPIALGCLALGVLFDCLLFGIQIWRLWVVLSSSRYAIFVIAPPVLASLAYLSIELFVVILTGKGKPAPSNGFFTAYESLNVAVDLFVTLSIIACIMIVRKQQNKLMGKSTLGSQYTTIITILVESFALNTLWMTAEIATSQSNGFQGYSAYYFLSGSQPYIQIISYLLIVYRVATGRAWKEDTGKKLTSLQFNRGLQTIEGTSRVAGTTVEFPQGSHSIAADV
ncbi:hypothetical protein AN958_12353 [Leucoagaricus sp. SymC.cos]|nr:hypothetical protein AN958_12353 [Leucoagaricus sp. SymC.cos]